MYGSTQNGERAAMLTKASFGNHSGCTTAPTGYAAEALRRPLVSAGGHGPRRCFQHCTCIRRPLPSRMALLLALPPPGRCRVLLLPLGWPEPHSRLASVAPTLLQAGAAVLPGVGVQGHGRLGRRQAMVRKAQC